MNNASLTLANIKSETEMPAVIVDHLGFIIFVNEPFEKVFGWQSEDIIGKPVATIIPLDMHDAHNLGFSRFITTGQPRILDQPVKLKAMNRAGEIFEAEHFITAELQNNEWVVGATIRPLTNT